MSDDEPARIEVWKAMADHFLDTETRHDIPLTALRCVQAGLTMDEARDVWRYEVTPAVGLNLMLVAGEWAAWDEDWLVERIRRVRKRWWNRSRTARRLRDCVELGWLLRIWPGIERGIFVLSREPSREAQGDLATDLAWLARHWFDFCPDDPRELDAHSRTRIAALYPEPFCSLVSPATVPGEGLLGHCRIQIALDRTRAPADHLRRRFLSALQLAGAEAGGDVLFDEIVARYSEPHRHYHTLRHVAACLRTLDDLSLLCEHPAEVELALWFHDAIYDPNRSDNESASAELARSGLAKLKVPAACIDRVASAVVATADHVPRTRDEAVVSDVDLAILGTRESDFDQFERQIAREFSHVPAPLFRQGRQRVLNEFLSRTAIYRVPKINSLLEQNARRNLERRIDELACLMP